MLACRSRVHLASSAENKVKIVARTRALTLNLTFPTCLEYSMCCSCSFIATLAVGAACAPAAVSPATVTTAPVAAELLAAVGTAPAAVDIVAVPTAGGLVAFAGVAVAAALVPAPNCAAVAAVSGVHSLIHTLIHLNTQIIHVIRKVNTKVPLFNTHSYLIHVLACIKKT
jgi:hypothetical protein